jgi:hypothetical protein
MSDYKWCEQLHKFISKNCSHHIILWEKLSTRQLRTWNLTHYEIKVVCTLSINLLIDMHLQCEVAKLYFQNILELAFTRLRW